MLSLNTWLAALINFVNPELLGCMGTFKRIFGDPIMRARDRGATPEEADLGQRRSAELNRRVEAFVLRRTKDVNAAYLPPLANYVVLCLPSPLQVPNSSRLYVAEFYVHNLSITMLPCNIVFSHVCHSEK